MIFENMDKNIKISDPGGFCSVWCFFYTYYRITYDNIPRNKLINIIIKKIKELKISFKNIIRNYTYKIVRYRDKFLKKINIDIDDWNNNNCSDINV
jgi:hypothetical protein